MPPLGLGCMRLSTAPDRDDERSLAVLHAALDAGVRLLDTADVYAQGEHDIGHNERLIARALATWKGDRSAVTVATKGGLVRSGAEWAHDGRARHLRAACEASCHALGVDRIALYQLHAPDPAVPLGTSVRALARLQRDGLVEEIGLSNVTVGQIEEASKHARISAIQVELSPWREDNLLNGVAELCRDRGIRLLAYRPVGGPERRRHLLADPVLAAVASRNGATPFEIVLAWLRDLSPVVVPLPGATRVETVRSIARAAQIALDDEDRSRLDERFPAGRLLREKAAPRAQRRSRGDGDVVLVMGLPAAGKSTIARDLVAQGYERLNRDEAGGTVQDLLPVLERLAREGKRRFVLDNTYVSRKSRRPVLERAQALGLAGRGMWLDTTLEDAQVNAVERMVARYGRVLGPEEMKAAARKDPGVFPPVAQFRMKRDTELPTVAEGFSRVDVVPFVRRPDPSRTARGLVAWCEGVLVQSLSGKRAPASPEDVIVLPRPARVLQRYADEGYRLVALSWRPDVALGAVTRDAVDAVHARIVEELGLTLDILYCPHPAGPPICWCRKPLPGLGVLALHRHGLDVAKSLYVGAGTQDVGFARRLGLEYREAADVFTDVG